MRKNVYVAYDTVTGAMVTRTTERSYSHAVFATMTYSDPGRCNAGDPICIGFCRDECGSPYTFTHDDLCLGASS